MIKGGNPVPKIDFELEEIVARIKKGTSMRMIALVVFFLLISFAGSSGLLSGSLSSPYIGYF